MAIDYDVKQFFESDLPAYAAYDNVRKLACYTDGLKMSMRKIIYTFIEKYHNSKEKIKTETVANVTAAFTNYLHGSANLCGVCNTLTQSFVGANNYPLLTGNSGGFGTRINPECAAPRYTKIALSDIVKLLLHKDDYPLFVKQYFEGDYIEPKYFVPIFPILFLNGSSGISTGFSQDIYPRNPLEVIKYIEACLKNTEADANLLPWFRGHLGKVEHNSETDAVESFGIIEKRTMSAYVISELPIGLDPQKYCDILDKLIENGTIVDYDDKCDTKDDSICFEIKTTREFTKKIKSERHLYETFKLIKNLPETYCCIDENNRVHEFQTVYDILNSYIDIRLDFYSQRKKYLLQELKDKIILMASKYVFIKNVCEDKIIINKRTKADIISQIEQFPKIIKIDNSYDYLLKMQLSSLTKEMLDKLAEEILKAKDEFNKIKSTDVIDMWLTDLNELKKYF